MTNALWQDFFCWCSAKSLTGIPTALYIEVNQIINIGTGDRFSFFAIEGALDSERRKTR